MTTHLDITDYKALRTFVRFTGMGVMPSKERADAVLDVIDLAGDSQQLASVREVAQGVQAGVLVRQDLCLKANRDLERLMFQADQIQDRPTSGGAHA